MIEHTSAGWRAWLLLGIVTAAVLLLLWWAVNKPAVCTLVDPPQGPCDQELRVLPATIGLIVVLALAAATVLAGLLAPRRIRRSAVTIGAVLLGITGCVFVLLTLFATGFSLP